MSQDRIYSTPHGAVKDFAFDEQVADVFNDMINRSVPGYTTILHTLGKLAPRFAKSGSRIYDLGCSLGAASLAIKRSVDIEGVELIAVDSSAAMISRAERQLAAYKGKVEVSLKEADIRDIDIENASLVVLNFTLQFLPQDDRDALINKIYAGLRPGGLLLLSEKLVFADSAINDLLSELHWDFKRDNGYSELEIAQKRTAIENVMRPDSPEIHLKRLKDAGFSHSQFWYQCYNFASLVAIK
ncbi:carboxy-S-adenosyl-L-methionine synthase CmoA [Gallaecimonas pentaromativorans]|uniref:carboxy-S-adenosyl-L-methionine synthase CmoA n=1 Tax=Gallaecimonas pentaromativorans TaxID=584787 RepID=UPI00067F1189|nr:carboxy-S-adenosyl-L-methionine synthase CmoA [Gallaecimonas pentaromativorans]MED5524429.1 carboxy-S-adenosyl-L-methionine synthase CmoA [Pseudomonadota bacterium]